MTSSDQPESGRPTVRDRLKTLSATRPAGPDDGSPATWSERYVRLASILLAVAIASIWIASYLSDQSVVELLSLLRHDGHCDPATQGVGVHCFGDFSLVREGFQHGAPWTAGSGPVAIYPPIAWLPAWICATLGDHLLGGQAGLALYLLLSALCLAAPGLWAARGRWRRDGASRFLLLTAAAAPVLVILDRGNSLAFTVPWLLLAGLGFLRDDSRLQFWGIVLASLLKPQFVLLLVLPLCRRRYRVAIAAALTSAAVTLGSFLVFGANAVLYATNWLKAMVAYGSYQSIEAAYPYNLGASRSILTLLELLVFGVMGPARQQAVVGALGSTTGIVSIAVLVLLGATILVVRRTASRFYLLVLAMLLPLFASSVVFHYYTVVFVVLAALIVRDPRVPSELTSRTGALDGQVHDDPVLDRMTLWAAALCLAPIAIPTAYPSFLVGDAAAAVGTVGLWPILIGPIVLCYAAFLTIGVIAGTVRARRTAALAEGSG